MGLHSTINGKVVIGLSERILIKNSSGQKGVRAKVDTGATNSSIDIVLAKSLHLGPIIAQKLVKSSHGKSIRPVIEATITLAGKQITAKFTLADRKGLKYPILLGQNILKKGFLIDPSP